MFINKKGVSEVVANVLIILLVIVGVAVIWQVVTPTFDKGASSIKATDCLSLSLEAVSCKLTEKVIIQRGSGPGTLTGLKLIFENAVGERYVSTQTLVAGELDELESKTFVQSSYYTAPIYNSASPPAIINESIPSTSFILSSPIKLSVSAVLDADGESITCDTVSQPKECI